MRWFLISMFILSGCLNPRDVSSDPPDPGDPSEPAIESISLCDFSDAPQGEPVPMLVARADRDLLLIAQDGSHRVAHRFGEVDEDCEWHNGELQTRGDFIAASSYCAVSPLPMGSTTPDWWREVVLLRRNGDVVWHQTSQMGLRSREKGHVLRAGALHLGQDGYLAVRTGYVRGFVVDPQGQMEDIPQGGPIGIAAEGGTTLVQETFSDQPAHGGSWWKWGTYVPQTESVEPLRHPRFSTSRNSAPVVMGSDFIYISRDAEGNPLLVKENSEASTTIQLPDPTGLTQGASRSADVPFIRDIRGERWVLIAFWHSSVVWRVDLSSGTVDEMVIESSTDHPALENSISPGWKSDVGLSFEVRLHTDGALLLAVADDERQSAALYTSENGSRWSQLGPEITSDDLETNIDSIANLTQNQTTVMHATRDFRFGDENEDPFAFRVLHQNTEIAEISGFMALSRDGACVVHMGSSDEPQLIAINVHEPDSTRVLLAPDVTKVRWLD